MKRNAAQQHVYDAAREQVQSRARGGCEVQTEHCWGRGDQAHHRHRQGQGGPDTPENLLWVCTPCHEWVHRNVAASKEEGWLLPAWHQWPEVA